MKGIAVDMLGILALALLTILVGAGLIQSMSMDVSETLPAQMTKIIQDIVDSMFPEDYNLCESLEGKKIKYGEFKSLMSAMIGGVCNQTQVQIDFSLTENDLQRIAEDAGASGYLLVDRKEPTGAGMLLIRGNPGTNVLKYDDTLNITAAGRPKTDVMIFVAIPGCDPYNHKCEMSCSFKENICDPYCYRADQHEDVPCDIDCVDIDGSGAIDYNDRDNVCDKDCYNDVEDPGRAYDPDCVPGDADGICDPDSNGVEDGVCDPDCGQNPFICDPDCIGDRACICDGDCNGYCSIKCKDEIIYPENDPDCLRDERGVACCGDNVCGFTEECQACPDDCPPMGGCSGLGKVCCPQHNTKDEYGCSSTFDIEEGKPCRCDTQCSGVMVCSPGKIQGLFCCPKGRKWDGQICKMEADVLIVALKGTMQAVYSTSEITSLETKVGEFTDALAQEGLSSMLIYLDQKETSDIIGSKVEDTTSSTQIQAVLEQLIPKLKSQYLIILGGHNRFPQTSLPVGSCRDPLYRNYMTDDYYADFRPKDNMPDIPVGRIPDPNSGDIRVLLNALDKAIELHYSGGLDLSDYQSTVMWTDDQGNGPFSSGVCAHLAIYETECDQDSRCDLRGNYQTADQREVFMVLVHGGNTPPQSFSDGVLGFSMTSRNMPEIDVNDAIWLVMACYGGMIDNKNFRADSMIMQFLYGGGAVYFGGTRTQLGRGFGSYPCSKGGDRLIGTFYAFVGQEFDVGDRIGDSYLKGKNRYLRETRETCTARIYHQTLLYGDPTLKIKRLWYATA